MAAPSPTPNAGLAILGSVEEVDVTTWTYIGVEELGSKPNKRWLEHDGELWLFKPVTRQRHRGGSFQKGDDWAEKIAAELAHSLRLPAATIELARHSGTPGIISRNIAGDRDLVLGNEVLAGTQPDYPRHQRHGVDTYTVAAVLDALHALDVRTPDPESTALGADGLFGGYLLLDALVGNTDRHHENWGVLRDRAGKRPPVLAPTFDHASSLGFQLSDEDRAERLRTNDRGRTVEAYARRPRSRHFAARPSLQALALEACASQAPLWIDRLEAVTATLVEEAVAAVPEDRMSHPARTFVVRMVIENERRLRRELGTIAG
jgi:hypothetical protein